MRLLDLDPGETAAAERLADELLYPDGETQVAWRGGRRLTARLTRSGGRQGGRLELPAESGWRLARDSGGALGALRAERVALPAPGPGEVRVAVEASGLNFLDVMSGMGLVEVDAPLGVEFCGRVLAVGAGVEGLSEGERVVGFGAGAFGPELVTRAELVVPAPGGHSAAALATIPVAFVTAALAFEWAGLEEGDAVLVHAGSGGVGHAAIQWARAAGLEVVATASAGKREHVRGLGVSEVFDSRSVGFGEEVLEATGGAGVRMVLNSLTGEGFIEASLSCLSEGGRFVELGKRGIWGEEEMFSARPDVGYWVLAVDRLLAEDPGRVGSVLRGVLERLGSGELAPLPYRRFPLSEAGGCAGAHAGGAARGEAGGGSFGAVARGAAGGPELPGDGGIRWDRAAGWRVGWRDRGSRERWCWRVGVRRVRRRRRRLQGCVRGGWRSGLRSAT